MQIATKPMPRENDPFDPLVTAMQAHFTSVLERNGPHLFTVGTDINLYDIYLQSLSDGERQYHTCYTCRHFVSHYGSLVSVNDDGSLDSAVWPDAAVPELYDDAVRALRHIVRRGRITGPALFREAVWGIPQTGVWTHFAITPPEVMLFTKSVQSPGQSVAEKVEDYRTLSRGLVSFDRRTIAQALTLLESDALYRSEAVIGPARLLYELHTLREQYHGRRFDNLIWKHVVQAAPGFCHPRSTMIGTLLEDITAGLPFDQIKRRFATKMNPTKYQRPVSAPTTGNVAQAEKLVESLGIASALKRRFARLEEIQTVWKPSGMPHVRPIDVTGIFSHLLTQEPTSPHEIVTPAITITWVKFAQTVLPTARRIEVYTSTVMNLCAILTAVDPDAPPIIQWDRSEQRNPFSWYVYPMGSRPSQWGLASGTWVSVTGITLQPSLWFDPDRATHHGRSVIFVLADCRDTNEAGLGLFPEILRSELHAVRATIEAYSRSRQLEGRDDASACGLCVGDTGGRSANQIRVTTDHGTTLYHIDRWD